MRRKHYRIWSMVKKLKIMEYENKHSMKWNMASNTEQSGKWEIYTLGRGLWQETLKNVEKEKCTL